MPLSWNEIRQRAITFSREWADASKENAEAHTFWNEFFNVFGKHRRTVATFEESVKSLQGTAHRIDVFWPGRLIGEHKSRGSDLAKAHTQAVGYITDLINQGREAFSPQRRGGREGRQQGRFVHRLHRLHRFVAGTGCRCYQSFTQTVRGAVCLILP